MQAKVRPQLGLLYVLAAHDLNEAQTAFDNHQANFAEVTHIAQGFFDLAGDVRGQECRVLIAVSAFQHGLADNGRDLLSRRSIHGNLSSEGDDGRGSEKTKSDPRAISP